MIGFVVLVWAADRFVMGSAAAATNLGVPHLLVGLTIVGFGTSAPEFLVSGMAALQGSEDIGVGNALGSNITNITMVLGAAALVAPMKVRPDVFRRELPFLLASMGLALLLLIDSHLSRFDGLVLLGGLGVLMVWIIRRGLREKELPEELQDEMPDPMPTKKAVFWLLVGLLFLLASSKALVWGAATLARTLGVPELAVGLTVIAIGTSLPEFAASVMAAYRGQHDLAVGNVLGSNLFNTLGVLALPGLIDPSPVSELILRRDIPVMFGVVLLLFGMVRLWPPKYRLGRVQGSILLVCFVAYLGSIYLVERYPALLG